MNHNSNNEVIPEASNIHVNSSHQLSINGSNGTVTATTTNSNGFAMTNGINGHANDSNGNGTAKADHRPEQEVECIDLDDDDEVANVMESAAKQKAPTVEPPAKRKRLEHNASPVPEDPDTNPTDENPNAVVKENSAPPRHLPPTGSAAASPKVSAAGGAPSTSQLAAASSSSSSSSLTTRKEPQLTSYSVLLDRLEEYVGTALDKKDNVERKILDVLLAAINIQVQREPYSVRKLILDKQLVLPNTISFPPSQVVDVMIEHDADTQLSRVIAKLFGDEKPKISEAERRERQQMRAVHAAPHFTKLFMDIGQDLVQESTYSDIVHARNLPEVPKNMETYNQVATQLKPVWESLRAKNQPFRLHAQTCRVCGFKSENNVVMSIHRQAPHFIGRKYQCAFCPEFDTNEHRINRHYIEVHELKPLPREEFPSKVQCPICDEDFMYKGHRDNHLKTCKRDYVKLKTVQATQTPDHISMVNRWLWERPPAEMSIIAQQQQQQQARQQQLAQQLAQQQAKERAAAMAAQRQLLLQQQQQQQRAKEAAAAAVAMAASRANAANLNHTSLNLHNLNSTHRDQLMKMLTGPNASQLTPQLLQAVIQAANKPNSNAVNKSNSASPFSASSSFQRQSSTGSQQRNRLSQNPSADRSTSTSLASSMSTLPSTDGGSSSVLQCEICDKNMNEKVEYLVHLQSIHDKLRGRMNADGAPLACSRCRDRFWTYEGLERHLVMVHGLVTSDLLAKAQRKEDGGSCKMCGKFAFNMLQHLVNDHNKKLCSAEIMYSCDVCIFKCSYQKLESHLSEKHPRTNDAAYLR